MKLSASIPREVEVDVEEEDEQYLALPQTLLQHSPDGMEAFDAVLDVVFSDVYQTAAPFLKVWRRSTGEAVSLTRLQTWIDQWRNANENMMDQGMDHRVYHLGTLVQEYHPVIFREQFNTLHLCEVVNHLQLIAEDVGQSAFANSCILLCLSLLGPYLGLRFTPAQHKLLVQKCTNREECLAEVYTL